MSQSEAGWGTLNERGAGECGAKEPRNVGTLNEGGGRMRCERRAEEMAETP